MGASGVTVDDHIYLQVVASTDWVVTDWVGGKDCRSTVQPPHLHCGYSPVFFAMTQTASHDGQWTTDDDGLVSFSEMRGIPRNNPGDDGWLVQIVRGERFSIIPESLIS